MEKEKIVNILNEIFSEVFQRDIVVTDSLTANDVDGWDSINHMFLITAIEKKFNIKFSLRDLNRMPDVGALIELILAKVQ